MQTRLPSDQINARPFLKWAGGKTQLLGDINQRLPGHILRDGVIDNYVEPFVGGGAMFFSLKSNFEIRESHLFDVNPELIVGYKVIQKNHKGLINRLYEIQNSYLSLENDTRESLYYEIRDLYNEQGTSFNYSRYTKQWVDRAAYLIFLNKTCYNGLFRQNRKGEFNVPFGDYKHPKICDEPNLLEISRALKNTTILCGDFDTSRRFIKKGTLVYLDPPYRPLNSTSSFTGYAKNGFTDGDQERLAKYYKAMDEQGAYLILSNSDPKNHDPKDDFFEALYGRYHLDRVMATRMINCQADKRGSIHELIITNY